MLVANKCDRSLASDFTRITERVETLVKKMLKEWKDHRNEPYVTEVVLLGGVSRISCKDYVGFVELVNRVLEQAATEIQLPPTWHLALVVVNALRDRISPLEAVRRHVEQDETGVVGLKPGHAGVNALMTKEEMFHLWKEVIHTISSEVHTAGQTARISNWENALDGALWIRYVMDMIFLRFHCFIVFCTSIVHAHEMLGTSGENSNLVHCG